MHRQSPRTHRHIFFSAYRWGSVHRISPSSDIRSSGLLIWQGTRAGNALGNPEFTPAEGRSVQSPQDSSGCKCLRTGSFWTCRILHESLCVQARAVFSFHKILGLNLRYVQCMCLFKEYLFHGQQHKVLVQQVGRAQLPHLGQPGGYQALGIRMPP